MENPDNNLATETTQVHIGLLIMVSQLFKCHKVKLLTNLIFKKLT